MPARARLSKDGYEGVKPYGVLQPSMRRSGISIKVFSSSELEVTMRTWPLWFFCLYTLGLVLVFGSLQIGYGQTQTPMVTEANADESTAVVAIINGKRVITRKEIDDVIGSQIYTLQERLYNLRQTVLENLLTKILLEEEAKARSISVEQLKQQLMPEKVDIRQSKIDEVYAQNAGSLGNMSEDEAKQRIKVELESHEKIERYKAALAELRGKARIERFLVEPVPPIVNVSDSGPSKGPKGAPATIVEFSDFQCPYCKQSTNILKQVQQSYGENVRLVFKHTPLPIHPDAFKASPAAVCAGEQAKFWEYHDRLFSSDDLSTDALGKYAAELGLKMNEFNACLNSEASRAAVLKDMQEARQADVQGTPTFVINGRVQKGARGLEDFKKVIDEELKKRLKAKG